MGRRGRMRGMKFSIGTKWPTITRVGLPVQTGSKDEQSSD